MHKQTITISGARQRLAGLYVISFFVLLGAASSVMAAEWRFEPVLRIAGDFDDNPYLSIRTDVDKDESGFIAEGTARVAYLSQTTDFFMTPTLRSSNYGSDSDLNSDDQFLSLGFGHSTQSTTFRLRGRYARESVRTAERADADLDIEDPDEIPDNESGIVSLLGRRQGMYITPSFEYRMSGVSSIGLELNHSDVRYEDVFAGLLTDYTDSRINASYRRGWTPRTTGIFTATYRNYQTERGQNEVSGAGLTVGLDHRISETTRFRIAGGFENTEVLDDESDVNWVANVSFVRTLKTTRLIAQYRRSISASGSGALATRDSINLNFTRDLSDRISAGIGARVYSTNAIAETAVSTFDERDYVQLRAQFIWHMSTTMSLETNYRYTFLARENVGESANSNQVTVWFNYRPVPMTRSR